MQHHLRFVFLVLLLICPFVPNARASNNGTKTDSLRAVYNSMVVLSKQLSPLADYAQMRAIYSELPDYRPYGSCVDNVEKARQEGDLVEAKRLLDECLLKEWVNLSVHFQALRVYVSLKDTAQQEYHLKVAQALVGAIQMSGTGRDAETAMDVLYAGEEYDMLLSYGVEFKMQSLKYVGDSSYDVMQGIDENGQPVTYWFRVDKLLGWLRKTMRDK